MGVTEIKVYMLSFLDTYALTRHCERTANGSAKRRLATERKVAATVWSGQSGDEAGSQCQQYGSAVAAALLVTM
jgi:hypothetical protein